jgi:hypothetical protein
MPQDQPQSNSALGDPALPETAVHDQLPTDKASMGLYGKMGRPFQGIWRDIKTVSLSFVLEA